MKRFTIVFCTWCIGLTGIAAAQPLVATTAGREGVSPLVKSVAVPPRSYTEILPPVPSAPMAVSPGEVQVTPEARAHELHLLQSQTQNESVHRAAAARAEQRTRRLESQRWFGISNTRPTASVDPYNGDYSASWVSNYPFYPMRWLGGGEPWSYVEGQ